MKYTGKHLIGILLVLPWMFVACGDLQSIFNGEVKSAPVAHDKTNSPVVESVSETPIEQDTAKQPKIVSQQQKKTVLESASDDVIVSPANRTPIVTKKGTYYFVAPGDSLAGIAKQYSISPQDLAQINDLFDSTLSVGRRLFIPSKRTIGEFLDVTHLVKQNKIERDRKNQKVTFGWPLESFVLTSHFGWRHGRQHTGVDLAAKPGTEILAAADGTVIFAQYSKTFAGYGNLVVIKHSGNYFSAYGHAQKVFVAVGDSVKKGQRVALVGSTGHATGPHLHFEVLKKTQVIDPLTVMPPIPQGSEAKER